MLNYVWCFIIIFSIICAAATGNMESLTNSVLNSAEDAVSLIIAMTGAICFWNGIMEIAEKSGIVKKIAKVLSPILSKLFPNVDKNGKAFAAISANVTANLLGIGNAATPLGIKAMRELENENKLLKTTFTADRNMIMFVILNTTSFQLMPTMILTIMQSCGASNPTSIIPYVWAASVAGLAAGILSVNILCRDKKRE